MFAVALLCGSAFASAGLSPEQMSQLRAFPKVEHLVLDPSGVPTAIAGRLGFAGFGPVDRAAHGFAGNLVPLFRGGGEERFQTLRVDRDADGVAHVRLAEQYAGLPIVGAELVVHVKESTGEVTGINGRFVKAAKLPVQPAVGSVAAIESAAREAGIAAPQLFEAPYLTYIADDSGTPHLAWAARVGYWDQQEGIEHDRLFADALDGRLVAKHALIWRAKNRLIYTAGNSTSLPGTFLFGEGGSSGDTDAQSAYNYTGNAYDYYSARHGRDSWNGSGGNIISSVHYDVSYNNAFWTSSGNQIAFGDGDGSQFIGFARGLDVVAHEFTHGVTQATANLIYSNESGALNEAMSDIFGAATEAYVRGVGSNTWKVGEDIYTPGTFGDAMRYMNNPTQDGSSKDYYPERYTGGADNGGVHWNSGIANLAFYLVSQGGSHPRGKTSVVVPSIGMTNAERIFYRALTSYMNSSTNFANARENTAQAAMDLNGPCGGQYDAVQKSWDAVGVPRSLGHEYEPNDSMTQANSFNGSSGSASGYLCTSGDADWYSFTKWSDYMPVYISLYPPASSDYDIELWQQGNGIRSMSAQTGNGVMESIMWTYGTGTFLVKVVGKNGAYNTSSAYYLTVSQ